MSCLPDRGQECSCGDEGEMLSEGDTCRGGKARGGVWGAGDMEALWGWESLLFCEYRMRMVWFVCVA